MKKSRRNAREDRRIIAASCLRRIGEKENLFSINDNLVLSTSYIITRATLLPDRIRSSDRRDVKKINRRFRVAGLFAIKYLEGNASTSFSKSAYANISFFFPSRSRSGAAHISGINLGLNWGFVQELHNAKLTILR